MLQLSCLAEGDAMFEVFSKIQISSFGNVSDS